MIHTYGRGVRTPPHGGSVTEVIAERKAAVQGSRDSRGIGDMVMDQLVDKLRAGGHFCKAAKAGCGCATSCASSRHDFDHGVLDNSNPVRDQHYECQIEHFQLGCSKRALQQALQPQRARRYKKAITRCISEKNKGERVQYGKEHKGKTIRDFWEYVHFTDEAHIDPSEFGQGYILREPGTRYEACNLQEQSSQKEWESLGGAKLYIAASISWHYKSPLLFYNDENDQPPPPPPKPPRPRRRPTIETLEQYHQRVLKWEAHLPHDVEVKLKGNSMTQAYYIERLLPVYINLIHKARVEHGMDTLLQEDNDPSHGTCSVDNVARELKNSNWVATITHPAQSPNLNPIGEIWNILKQRVRQREWYGLAQLKHLL